MKNVNFILKHTEVRKSVNELPQIYSFIPTFNSNYIVHNSWVKLQGYFPSFGGKLIRQKQFEFDDQPQDV